MNSVALVNVTFEKSEIRMLFAVTSLPVRPAAAGSKVKDGGSAAMAAEPAAAMASATAVRSSGKRVEEIFMDMVLS